MPGSSRDLAEILGRVANRDREAFEALYRATSAKLYGIIVSILVQRGVADEVLQEVYVRIWERAADFDETRASPVTWMATIARNRALDEARRAKTLPTTAMPEGFDAAAEAVDPLGGRQRSEELQKLMRCLGDLEKEKREAVLLAYYRGLSREALSQRFDRPVATIKTWLHRSLSQLRVCLTQ